MFEDGRFDDALVHLEALYNNPSDRVGFEKDLARMLLWIHAEPDRFNAKRIVEVFEILRERHPELVIPFEKILVVGRAYRESVEFVVRVMEEESRKLIRGASLVVQKRTDGDQIGEVV